MRVGDLVPHDKNPRKIKAAEKKKLWDRIQKYGMIGIPVRDIAGKLLSGNRRCEVLVQNGMADMIIDVRTATRELTEAEYKEVMVIENSHAGEWDLEALKAEFDQHVDLDDFGLAMEEFTQQIEQAAKSVEQQQPEMPIVRKYSEQYNSVVVICDDEIDFNHISEKLGLDRAKCYKSSKVGMTHVIDAKTLIALLTK